MRNSRQPSATNLQTLQDLIEAQGDDTPIVWLTPPMSALCRKAGDAGCLTIADMIGDIDPIKTARSGRDLSNELTVHYGLMGRASRGIFAINELPDLAGKIQVGLFNIMQEGDVQIKAIRCVCRLISCWCSPWPILEDIDTRAEGKIITPLKDRTGKRDSHALSDHRGACGWLIIPRQESWTQSAHLPSRQRGGQLYPGEIVEQLAFPALQKTRRWTSSSSVCAECWPDFRAGERHLHFGAAGV